MVLSFMLLTLAFSPLTSQQLEQTAERIYFNECCAKKENLVHWKVGEDFPSLGIGHFIWYSEGQQGPFEEGFPLFIDYCQKAAVILPSFLQEHRHCPWKTRQEFLQAPKKTIDELTSFFLKTKALQARCIAERLYGSLPKITAHLSTDEKKLIEKRFAKIASCPAGMYALIDYVNFKGEGVNKSERYNNRGWGLLQVLEEMKDQDDVMASFRDAAKKVLAIRVANAPSERNEGRWLQGWCNRIDTYK